MADTRSSGICNNASGRETVCIDTYQILDSCRDRDCYENVRVMLTGTGQRAISANCNVRVTRTRVLWASVTVDPVPFNGGFYQVSIRYYVMVSAESCTAPGTVTSFDGLITLDKRVVLYGGEGNATVFKSSSTSADVCALPDVGVSDLHPLGVVETVDPVVLDHRVCDCTDVPKTRCDCACSEIPANVAANFDGPFEEANDGVGLYISLGIFSVVRIERPAQYLITAADYCVPDKECVSTEPKDPCSLFRAMDFPTGEFCPQSRLGGTQTPPPASGICSCHNQPNR